MAKIFNSFTLMVVLALASRVVVATNVVIGVTTPISPEASFEDEAPIPPSDEEFPPEPSPEEKQYYRACIEKMTEECSDVIFSDIFNDEKQVISEDCCHKLVIMGRQCHDRLVKLITEVPEFKGNASITVPKSVEVWDKCVKVAGEISPSPSSS